LYFFQNSLQGGNARRAPEERRNDSSAKALCELLEVLKRRLCTSQTNG